MEAKIQSLAIKIQLKVIATKLMGHPITPKGIKIM